MAREQKYNLSEDAFWEMFNGQNGKCASCDSDCPEPDIMVDHDHACCAGQRSCGLCVRSLLCRGCNTALGLINDDPNRALALASYLMRFENVLSNL